MALATLTTRVDEFDKQQFDAFCSSVGLTPSAAINMYVKAVLREHRIPFEIKDPDLFYNKGNVEHVLKALSELKEGKGIAHDLIEDDDE